MVACEASATGKFDPARRGLRHVNMRVAELLDATLFAAASSNPRACDATDSQSRAHLFCKLPLSPALHADVAAMPLSMVASVPHAAETRFWLGAPGNGAALPLVRAALNICARVVLTVAASPVLVRLPPRLCRAPTDSVTSLHFDLCHSVIAQVVGRKRVHLFSPDDSAYLYPFAVAEGAPRVSRVDLGAWLSADATERAAHANVAHTTAFTCVLDAGDVLYIPPCWWHHVEAVTANISVLAPFDMSAEEQRTIPRPWTSPGWGR